MGKKLIVLGHGYDRNGNFDPGATGNGTSEHEWLNGVFLASLRKYADGHDIDFYTQNMFANRDANTVTGYDDIIELHLDAASAAAKGGHVIIYHKYSPDAMDHRLGNMIANHFGLRGGKMFHGRDNLYNLNTFAKRRLSYRLLELGFITNKENMDYFKKHYDVIARDLISAVVNQRIETDEGKGSSVEEKTPVPSTEQYTGIVEYMNRNNMDSSFANRAKLAAQYGIVGYKGTAEQNNALLRKLQTGAAVKPVKSIEQMAQEIIDNKHGNGHENRRRSLGISAAEYAKVRAEVNRRASGAPAAPRKTISQMADDIINNPKVPNGHAARQKWLGVDSATYEKVRARVNQLLR
ncbi:hypothetical protein JMA_27000 [Jeotgalibacillus malaysiensis]|uniref:Uncharacterized protein n=1 Tax=Jeotgalibacillus malaysiensis TaxID=1508404 RepID=A0A0B5ATH0_9BACL|nr:N-acetylmuramoyl-L-alanine amidase [Jeotgalibacillus malaysiensis]AJD92017.1 hypothetical protein JMA_27000 [Jeotgalibacillus malaysiensis]